MNASRSMPASMRGVPMPSQIRALRRNQAGYPIPFFAATIDGQIDLRIADPDKFARCVNERLCWVCGQKRRAGGIQKQKEMSNNPGLRNLPVNLGVSAFTIGPMCAINRATADPPSHPECAVYAARACPFLARPNMVRRDAGKPEGAAAAGISIDRNPGVTLVWTTDTWEIFRTEIGGVTGWMFKIGDPTDLSWWAEGRPATRTEIDASIATGLPILEAECARDPNPTDSRAALALQVAAAQHILPTR